MVFTRTRDITYHFDTNHVVTTRVEYGTDTIAKGNQLATSQGIDINGYLPNVPNRGNAAWQLAGWKVANTSATGSDIVGTRSCTEKLDLYAVWQKDCSSSVNWNGGTGSGGSLSGYAYYNNGNITPFACKLPTSASRSGYTFTDFSGNAAGATVNLLDKSTFICNWKAAQEDINVSAFTITYDAGGAGYRAFYTSSIPFTELHIRVTAADSFDNSHLRLRVAGNKYYSYMSGGAACWDVYGSFPAGTVVEIAHEHANTYSYNRTKNITGYAK